MKVKVVEIIQNIISLLDDCDYQDKSNWFEFRIEAIKRHDEGTPEYLEVLSEIKEVISGMGSFTDLSLLPSPSSKLSKLEAKRLQWELSENLFELIKKIEEKP